MQYNEYSIKKTLIYLQIRKIRRTVSRCHLKIGFLLAQVSESSLKPLPTHILLMLYDNLSIQFEL